MQAVYFGVRGLVGKMGRKEEGGGEGGDAEDGGKKGEGEGKGEGEREGK